MKKLSILLLITTVLAIGCDNKNKDLDAKYDTLMKQNDSIEAVHQQIMQTHKQMLADHQKFAEELKGMNVQDSSALKIIGEHDALLKRHQAIIDGHTELMKGHKELRADFATMSDAEKEAEIKQMKKDHDKIMKEQANIEEEQKEMRDQHEKLRKDISSDSTDKNEGN